MPVKRWTIFGPCRETSCTAITLNQESNFTRREKNHSLFHWNTLMYPERQEQIWMLCKNPASTTIGTSMGQEICLTLGQVSLSLLYRKSNLQTDICGPGDTDKTAVNIQARLFYGQNSGRNWEEMLSWRRDINGPMKNRNSTMPEDYEEFTSLTLRTRNSKKPLKMLARNWKRRMAPAVLCKTSKTCKHGVTRGKNQWDQIKNLRASWKPVNPQDCVWKTLYRIIMRTILQEKGTIHCNIKIWFTNLFLCLKPWKFLQQKQQWIKNGRNWKNSSVGPDESQK